MDITFSCQKCGQHIVIDETGAGQCFDCPTCNQSFTVPNKISNQVKKELADKNTLSNLHTEITKSAFFAPNKELADQNTFSTLLTQTTRSAFFTPTLVAANAIIFVALAICGVDNILEPTSGSLIKWGADYGPLTVSGEWWRLFTSIFVHIGIMHIAFNMWALLSIGQLVERLFGNFLFLLIYLVGGILGSITSVIIHPELVCAGASGAIFGLYGALIGFTVRQRGSIPKTVLSDLRNSALCFIGYNLIYGLKDGIDNSAHIGGLLCGAILGYMAAMPLDSQVRKTAFMRRVVLTCATLTILIGLPMFILGQSAIYVYRKVADQGNAAMQNHLGACYANGQGVTKDETEAVNWFRKAADQGNATAQRNLGRMYANGLGITKDETEAVKWCRKAADQGNASAQNDLGVCYQHGQGVTKDEAEAVRFYRKAVEQDNVSAQCNLGRMYLNGLGVTKNETEALKWFRKSAERGNAMAQRNLGWMYDEGLGITKDDAEALKWYHKAAEQGDADSMNFYAWLLLTTTNLILHNDQVALDYAQKAVAKTNWELWNKLDTLALALFQNGKIPEAIEAEKKAIALLPETKPEDERKEFQDRLKKFEATQK